MRDLSGRLLYVGVTRNGLQRFIEHSRDKSWWQEVATIQVEHIMCSRSLAEQYEREAIISERPLYNIAHNRQLPPPAVVDGVTLVEITDTPPMPHALANMPKYSVGMIVQHPNFGEGGVIEVTGEGEQTEVVVFFQQPVGMKYLAAMWAPMKIVAP